MTATQTSRTEEVSSSSPARPWRGIAAAAGLVVAAVTLVPWLVTGNSGTETRPIVRTSTTALPQQSAPASGQDSAGRTAANVHGPTAYVMFCENSPSLCAGTKSVTVNPGYVRFCENNPSLCEPARPH
jgi:hypothetical protein